MKSNLRILFISDAGDKRGAQKSLMELMITLRSDHNVTPILLTKKRNMLNDMCDKLEIENYAFWYREVMKSSPYDIKILNYFKHMISYIFYIIGGIKKKKVEKVGIDFGNIDLVHTNTNHVDIGCYINKKYGIPHIMHLREMGIEDFDSVIYHPNLYSYFNKYVTSFIAISECVKRGWIRKGIAEEKIDVIYNGIDVSPYKISNKVINDEIKIVVSGAVNKNKGQLDIVKALSYIPDKIREKIQVTFYGNTKFDYLNKIKKYIKNNNLREYVTFEKYTNQLGEELSKNSIGIISSKMEAFGRVTVEYMLSGLCIIASDTGANPEIIQDGQNGYLYKYGSPEELAQCIIKSYQNKEEVERMRKQAVLEAKEKYTTQINAENIKKLYEKILYEI